MVRLILFDIDGTLIHTHGAGVKAFEKVFKSEFKIDNAINGISFAGRTDTSLIREILVKNKLDGTKKNFDRFFESYYFWLDYYLCKCHGEICRGIWNFINQIMNLSTPPILGLLTGNVRLGAEIKLRHFQLWEYFTLGAFADDSEDRNQLAAIAKTRAEKFMEDNLASEEIVVVGDTVLDIQCAQFIKAKCLAVATGGNTLDQLVKLQPTWAVNNLDEVIVKDICR